MFGRIDNLTDVLLISFLGCPRFLYFIPPFNGYLMAISQLFFFSQLNMGLFNLFE